MTLSKPLKFTDFVQPICLPKSDDRIFRRCKVSGYGDLGTNSTKFTLPTSLQKTRIARVKTNIACKQYARKHIRTYIGKLQLESLVQKRNIYENALCGFGRDTDTCAGDSGGPLVCEEHNDYGETIYSLQGIVSNGYHCKKAAKRGVPGIYTRVGKYINWIKSGKP